MAVAAARRSLAELLDELVVERGELGADDPAEQQVGERRVAGEHRAVQVGADDAVAQHAVARRRPRCRRR